MSDISTLVTMPHVEMYTDGGCEPNPATLKKPSSLLSSRRRCFEDGIRGHLRVDRIRVLRVHPVLLTSPE
jgi:hypothetical protein